MLFLFVAASAVACDGCMSCGEEEEPSVEDAGEASADAQREDTRAEELAEATEEAEEAGDDLGFTLHQQARLAASEIEGASTDVEDPPSSKPSPKDDGKIDVDATQKVFERKRSVLQKCYERALKQNSSLQGKVTLAIRIGTDGSPSSVQAKSSAITDRAALDCMEREARSWSFPRPKGGTVMLNKPFQFSPDQ
ncbi:MAG: AgmX/PglI C-terminal domain-containing protein [Persicimonas sp.]